MMSKWTAPQIDGRTVAIIGAGSEGRRIALGWILSGFEVYLYDLDVSNRNTTAAFVAHNTRDLASYGKLHISTDIAETVTRAWLIVETVDEDHDSERSVFVRMADAASADAILATTSSSGLPQNFADGNIRGYIERTVGIRYVTSFVTGLVELLKSPDTSVKVVDFLSTRIRDCKFTCVIESTGSFRSITDRMRAAIERERVEIMAEGLAEAEQLDLVCQLLVSPRETSSGRAASRSSISTRRTRGGSAPNQVERMLRRNSVALKRNPTASSLLLNRAEPQISPLIYVLDLGTAVERPSLHTGRICIGSAKLNELQTLLDDQPRPDGIDICSTTGRMYWTCMGVPGEYDGLIRSCDLQGGTPVDLIPKGKINTPKQIAVDHVGSKLYFCDREGMRVWRCGLDGQDLEMIIQAGDPNDPAHHGDLTRWCVGMCISPSTKKFYWTQKGPSKGNKGRIFRANMDMPAGQTAQTRTDIECLLDDLPEPIDVEIDDDRQVLWWTDRGDYPNGNSLNQAQLGPDVRKNRRIVGRHFHEAIGLKIDWRNEHIYLSDIGGTVYRLDINGSNKTKVYDFEDAAFSGICLLHV